MKPVVRRTSNPVFVDKIRELCETTPHKTARVLPLYASGIITNNVNAVGLMNWKKFLLIGVGWGLGTAVGLAGIVGCFIRYQSRPKPPEPPKPWNRSAIKADYDHVDTDGDANTIVFYYTLENTTDFDYRIEDGRQITLTGKLKRENSLTNFKTTDKVIDYPVFVPAKKRVRFLIRLLGYSYTEKPKPKGNPNSGQRMQYRNDVEKYVEEQFSNLDGFDLLDATNRYEVVLPSGWNETKP